MKKILTIIFCLLFLFSAGLPLSAQAQEGPGNLQNAFGDKLDQASQAAGYDQAVDSPLEIVAMIVNIILSLLGIIFLILIIYAGFLWMTAGGNDQQVGKAKSLISSAIIGLIIVVSAYAISYFVIAFLTEGIIN
jgi:hypothetical protein